MSLFQGWTKHRHIGFTTILGRQRNSAIRTQGHRNIFKRWNSGSTTRDRVTSKDKPMQTKRYPVKNPKAEPTNHPTNFSPKQPQNQGQSQNQTQSRSQRAYAAYITSLHSIFEEQDRKWMLLSGLTTLTLMAYLHYSTSVSKKAHDMVEYHMRQEAFVPRRQTQRSDDEHVGSTTTTGLSAQEDIELNSNLGSEDDGNSNEDPVNHDDEIVKPNDSPSREFARGSDSTWKPV